MSVRNIGINSIIYISIVCAIMSWYFIPSITAQASTPVFAVILGLYMLLYVVPSYRLRNLFLKIQFLQLCYAFIVGVINYNFNYKEMLETFMMLEIVFAPFFIYKTIQYRGNKVETKIILIIVLAMIAYVLLNSFSAIGSDQNILRAATGSLISGERAILANSNIGNSRFSYMIGVLAPFFYAYFLKEDNRKIKLLLAFIFVACCIFVIKAQFTLLLLMLVVALALTTFLSKERNIVHSVLLFVGITILFVVLLPQLLSLLLLLTEGTRTGERISGLLAIVTQGADLFDLTSRVRLLIESYTLFFNNFVFGADMTVPKNELIMSSSHSLLSTILTHSGIVGTFIYYYILKLIYRNSVRNVDKIIMYPQCFCIAYILIFNSSIANFTMYLPLIFILPLFTDVYTLRKCEKYEK